MRFPVLAALGLLLPAAVASAQTATLAPPAVLVPTADVHVPPADRPDVVEALRAEGRFGTLLTALDAAGLTSRLKTSAEVTVFAPTDAAFAALPAGVVDRLLDPRNVETLRRVLLHHLVEAELAPAERAGVVRTEAGDALRLGATGDQLRVGPATVVADLPAANGAVLAVDRVILPEDLGAAAAGE